MRLGIEQREAENPKLGDRCRLWGISFKAGRLTLRLRSFRVQFQHMPAGRPAIPFDQKIADEICARLCESRRGLDHVLDEMRDGDFPSTPRRTTIYHWMAANERFANDSARARELSADTYVDAAVEEAHTSLIGRIDSTKETKDGTFSESRIADNVERSKLIVQTLLKRAGQLNPKKYGDRVTQEHTGEGGGPLVFQVKRVDE